MYLFNFWIYEETNGPIKLLQTGFITAVMLTDLVDNCEDAYKAGWYPNYRLRFQMICIGIKVTLKNYYRPVWYPRYQLSLPQLSIHL